MTADTEHPVVKPCQPQNTNVKIWRYMDLPKLVAFLETESLHFARADTLGDKFEGSWTLLNPLIHEDHRIPNIMADMDPNTPEHKRKLYLASLLKYHKNVSEEGKKIFYINCWHGGDTESAAMWRFYGAEAGSLVIQSTYEKLVSALPDHACTKREKHDGAKIYVCMVQYKDYKQEWIPDGNIMYPFIHKRKEFEYENEVRAFVLLPEDNNRLGIDVNININEVIESIRVRPGTPTWKLEAIERLIKRYGFGQKVEQSDIDFGPFF